MFCILRRRSIIIIKNHFTYFNDAAHKWTVGCYSYNNYCQTMKVNLILEQIESKRNFTFKLLKMHEFELLFMNSLKIIIFLVQNLMLMSDVLT